MISTELVQYSKVVYLLKLNVKKSSFLIIVDTESLARILSKIFYKMGVAPSKLKRIKKSLSAADGSNIEIFGKINLKLTLSRNVFKHERERFFFLLL